jgi:inosine-uridine nucleoside N-ribohydrolase
MHHIILDTDMGNDVDDALAMACCTASKAVGSVIWRQ